MYALIVAAGSGTRMGGETPKQFLPLKGKPILYYTIQQFLTFSPDMKVVLVIHPDYQPYIDHLLKLLPEFPLTIVHGGATRFESVKNGLQHIPEEDMVFIHDGVRPFVDHALMERCYAMASHHGCAIPCIPIKDSIRIVNGSSSDIVERENLRAIQTPQTFKSSLIKEAYQRAKHDHYTDDASVLEDMGEGIHLCLGAEHNVKITTPLDLQLAGLLV